MAHFFRLLMAISFVTLSACNIYRQYERPHSVISNDLYRDISLLAEDSTNIANISWRNFFSDVKLQVLIDTALQNNVDIKKTVIDLKIAEENLRKSRFAYAPSLSFNPSCDISHIYNTGKGKSEDGITTMRYNFSVPVVASWELDIFGKMANAKQVKKMQLLQSEEYVQAVRCRLISEIANAYTIHC